MLIVLVLVRISFSPNLGSQIAQTACDTADDLPPHFVFSLPPLYIL